MWQTFTIRPQYGLFQYGASETFYAPGIDAAFALARGRWPSAIGWGCL